MKEVDIIMAQVAKLTAGQSFGELALTDSRKNGSRKATIKCLSKCVFAVLNRTNYDRILGNSVRLRREATYKFLQNNPLFHDVTTSYMKSRGWEPKHFTRRA